MATPTGTRLGSYEIVSPLGAGGMGEVYLARDATLDRQVAIKVLPDAMTRDPERVARFQREAKVLASLNHTNIASIHGFDEANGTRFLVMEYVEGETLAQSLKGGALAIDDTLDIARQMAEALEAAHEQGVIHRDLKPANVMITAEGKVKVLDFGLAKAMAEDPSTSLSADSPTITANYTRPGVVLGTAAYMSPEQARGRPLDKRTDIWSFGVVLYECFTGRRPFEGETVSDLMAEILKVDPNWVTLPPDVPPTVQTLLRRCLTKDRHKRLRDIGDARIELEQTDTSASGLTIPAATTPTSVRSGSIIVAIICVVLGLAIGWTWHAMVAKPTETTDARPVAEPRRLSLTFDDVPVAKCTFHSALALSPDGTRLAYVGLQKGRTRLFLRRMDSYQSTMLRGTEGAEAPFFSPDGQWIGFYAANAVKKIAVNGGAPQTICMVPGLRGAAWGPDGTIVLSPGVSDGLFRVSASGGTPEQITQVDYEGREDSHRFPQFLPDGDTVLFGVLRAPSGTKNVYDRAPVFALSLKTGETTFLLEASVHTRYVPTGHLVFVRDGSMMAVPFETERLEVSASAVPVVDGVVTQLNTGASHFSVSRDGTLVYVPGEATGNDMSLIWVSRDGESELISRKPRQALRYPSISASGRRAIVTESGPIALLWVFDLQTRVATLFNVEGEGWDGHWMDDDRYINFGSSRDGPWNIYRKRTDGLGPVEILVESPYIKAANDYLSDDGLLLVSEDSPDTRTDIWVYDIKGSSERRAFLKTPAKEEGARLSPNGKWVAYTSDATGRFEVYVARFPDAVGRWQVSNGGGTEPVWSKDGTELFFRQGTSMLAAPVQTEPSFSHGTPSVLFEGWYEGVLTTPGRPNYDVHPDGDRFLMIKSDEKTSGATHVRVVLNWFEELKNKAPAKRD